MKKYTSLSAFIILFLTSCIPGNIKEEMDKSMNVGQQLMADSEFKKALANIELHKLRNGHYPNSLSELEFLSLMDSSIFQNVTYTRLDSGYELNNNVLFPSFNGKDLNKVELKYPAVFWEGLGCVKSNTK